MLNENIWSMNTDKCQQILCDISRSFDKYWLNHKLLIRKQQVILKVRNTEQKHPQSEVNTINKIKCQYGSLMNEIKTMHL